jgi:N-acetyl-gamma-glutamyl-phosphate reductase common form
VPVLLEPRTETASVCLVGASGLLAGEFLRLTAEHPGLSLGAAVSRTGGKSLTSLHPHLLTALTTLPLDDVGAAAKSCDVLVLALPHGHSAGLCRSLDAELDGKIVLDLSADHRLRNAAGFTYGLVELERERIVASQRIAVPGCFATALQLACVPAAASGLVNASETWTLTAITGSSGSGAEPKAGTHHPYRHANLWAYARDGHRDEAELLQALAPLDMSPPLCFLPHSGPFVRGIHLTAVLPLSGSLSSAAAQAAYREFYDGEPFVEILDEAPDLRRVVGSNRVALSTSVRGDKLVVLLTLDNVIKGGAGQALQCLNLALGWPETTALPRAGLGVL